MQCPNCEKEIDNNSTSCAYCGETIMKNYKKKLIIWVAGMLIVIVTIIFMIMSQPLNLVFHSDEMGDFNVSSDCSDNFLYRMTFTSFGTVNPEIEAILPLLKPNLIVRNTRMSGLSVHGHVNEPLVFDFRLRYGNGSKFMSCYHINKMMKQGFDNGFIQIEIDERFARKLK